MARANACTNIGLGVVLAWALVACGADPGSTSPSATATGGDSVPSEPARTPSSECINPAPDLLTLINQTDPVACYGDTPVTVEAEVTSIGAIDCAPVEPAWFNCGAWVGLQPIAAQARSTGFVLAATRGPNQALWMFATIHPDTAVAPQDIVGRQLRVTGHFDDPAAQTCRETAAPFGGPATPPDEVIASCRNLFVMTGFESV